MSGQRGVRQAQVSGDEADDETAGAGGDAERASLEARARVQGWKPLAEFRGDPAVWRDADEYLRRGEAEMPLLRERNRSLEQRVMRAEATAQRNIEVTTDISDRLRRADERAMKRAMDQLKKQQLEAVESGDVAAFNAADREIAELQAEAAAQKPAAGAGGQAEGRQQQQQNPQMPVPAVVAWAADNPWFTQDQQLRTAATTMHQALLVAEPDISLEENLERVTQSMRAMYPDRIGAPRRQAQGRQQQQTEEEEEETIVEQRRQAPARVAASREVGARRASPRSFEAMPADSKAAYQRYAAMIASKPNGAAKPLTKEEWAKDYWDQEGV